MNNKQELEARVMKWGRGYLSDSERPGNLNDIAHLLMSDLLAAIPAESVPDENGLLPCPFCGDTPKLYEDTVDSVGGIAFDGGHYIGACSQPCRCNISGYLPSKEQAVKTWNTRATPTKDTQAELIEAVTNCLDMIPQGQNKRDLEQALKGAK
jgi:hypothetical protein